MLQSAKDNIKNKFLSEGYCIFNVEDNELIKKINYDVENLLNDKKFKTNTKIYSYNESPRIVESYKYSLNCKALAKHPKIKAIIDYIFDDDAMPFSTINFLRSTQQPLHSDYMHFGTIPKLKLVGAWVALEDINPNSGPLQIVPGSHKWEIYNFLKNDKKPPSSLEEVKKNYTEYEEWVVREMNSKKINGTTPEMKKGDCILWDANLLHGSPECEDPTLSRKSQVTHWTFNSVDKHYNPSFSNIDKNIYQYRNLEYII